MKQTELFAAPPLAPGQLTESERKLAAAREEGERRKREGMRRAALAGADLLGYARELAHDLARANGGECHADMVAAALKEEGYPSLGNAAGSLFVPSVWEFTGRRVKSARVEAHANELKVWRLRHGVN